MGVWKTEVGLSRIDTTMATIGEGLGGMALPYLNRDFSRSNGAISRDTVITTD